MNIILSYLIFKQKDSLQGFRYATVCLFHILQNTFFLVCGPEIFKQTKRCLSNGQVQRTLRDNFNGKLRRDVVLFGSNETARGAWRMGRRSFGSWLSRQIILVRLQTFYDVVLKSHLEQIIILKWVCMVTCIFSIETYMNSMHVCIGQPLLEIHTLQIREYTQVNRVLPYTTFIRGTSFSRNFLSKLKRYTVFPNSKL